MRIKYITEDGLNTIRENAKIVYQGLIVEGSYLSAILNDEGIIKNTPFEIEDFKLDMSQPADSAPLTDIENVKRVYNNMKLLSDSQASEERVWAAYTLDHFLEYMKYRWPARNANDMANRYLFNYSQQRSLFRNGVSRLWWIGRCTYDDTRSNPYELTEYICKNQDLIETFCGRNVFNNPNIINPVLSAFLDAEKNGYSVSRDVARETAKYMNLLAGTYILDFFENKEIYDKAYNKIVALSGDLT